GTCIGSNAGILFLMFPSRRGNVLMTQLPIMPNNEDEMTDLISLEKIAQWQKLKTLVLDSLSSPITKRVYNMALDEFMGWFQQASRPGFTKATIVARGGYPWKSDAS